MPDIDLCLSETCRKRRLCYRHEAEPDDVGQSYDEFEPGVDGRCEGFLQLPAKKPAYTPSKHYKLFPKKPPLFYRAKRRKPAGEKRAD